MLPATCCMLFSLIFPGAYFELGKKINHLNALFLPNSVNMEYHKLFNLSIQLEMSTSLSEVMSVAIIVKQPRHFEKLQNKIKTDCNQS